MNRINGFLPLTGRIFLSAIFLMSGLGKIADWSGTAGYMSSKGMPFASLLLVGAIVFEICGGLSILLGFKTKIGSVALIIFLIPATLVFHNFWALEGMDQQMQMIMFMKNLAILGGLLTIIAHGSGTLALDNINKKNWSPIT